MSILQRYHNIRRLRKEVRTEIEKTQRDAVFSWERDLAWLPFNQLFTHLEMHYLRELAKELNDDGHNRPQ